MATSEEYTDFAFMTLTKHELTLGSEARKCIIRVSLQQSLIRIPYGKISGVTKNLTSVAGVPALKLSFLVTEIPREDHVQDGDDEVLGGLEPRLLNNNTND